jgi:dTDP-4-dehydrorhamnose reductase
MNNGVLVLGDGLLGSEIVKQTGWKYVSRGKDNFDISDIMTYGVIPECSTIVNCIANTDTYSEDIKAHWYSNYLGVYNLIEYCNQSGVKLVQISTDYVYANNKKEFPTEQDVPVHSEHWYSYTKLLADALIQLLSNEYLICRCTHKPVPFPYDSAFEDRVGNFDYVDNVAKLIIKLINKEAGGLYNVGTEVKTIYEMAKLTNPNVKPSKTPQGYPLKTTMNIDKLKKLLADDNIH